MGGEPLPDRIFFPARQARSPFHFSQGFPFSFTMHSAHPWNSWFPCPRTSADSPPVCTKMAGGPNTDIQTSLLIRFHLVLVLQRANELGEQQI